MRHYRVDRTGMWFAVDCHREGCTHGFDVQIVERPDGSVEIDFDTAPRPRRVPLITPVQSLGWMSW